MCGGTVRSTGKSRLTVYPRVCGGTSCRTLMDPSRVYPRVCGGTGSSLAWWRALRKGSIPACAGEPLMRRRRQALRGLSPRVRGNRVSHVADQSPAWVYPRVCGGTGDRDKNRRSAEGLSPRVRGNRRLSRGYPRVCGGTRTAWLGLSPRVRGNPRRARVPTQIPGSIPACAGEPRRRGQQPS